MITSEASLLLKILSEQQGIKESLRVIAEVQSCHIVLTALVAIMGIIILIKVLIMD